MLSLRYPDQQDCKPSPAKVSQEQLIEAAGQPYTIIRSTQFFELVRTFADSATHGDKVRVPTAKLQPIAAQELGKLMAAGPYDLGDTVDRVRYGGRSSPAATSSATSQRRLRRAQSRRRPARQLLQHRAHRRLAHAGPDARPGPPPSPSGSPSAAHRAAIARAHGWSRPHDLPAVTRSHRARLHKPARQSGE